MLLDQEILYARFALRDQCNPQRVPVAAVRVMQVNTPILTTCV
jgi:hypothetical protein